MISTVLSSRAKFERQVTYFIEAFIERLILEVGRVWDYQLEMFHDNLFASAFNTDWTLEIGNTSNGYLLRSLPVKFPNSTCTCMISSTCQRPLKIGPSDIILPGLVVGCLPIDGLRMSTLECFFSADCISTILQYIEYYTQIDGSPPLDFIPPTKLDFSITPLNNLTLSQFLPTTPIGELIDKLFIERWMKNISYETYFTLCEPISCRYEYVKRTNILYIVTSLLAIYGGLTVGLRFIIWYGILLLTYLKNRVRVYPM